MTTTTSQLPDFTHPLQERLRSRIDQLLDEIGVREDKISRLENEVLRLKNSRVSQLRWRCVWCGYPKDGQHSHAACIRTEKDYKAAWR